MSLLSLHNLGEKDKERSRQWQADTVQDMNLMGILQRIKDWGGGGGFAIKTLISLLVNPASFGL